MKPQTRNNRGVLANPYASAEAIVAAAVRPPKRKESSRKKLPPPPKHPQQEQSAPSPNPSEGIHSITAPVDPSTATTTPHVLNSPTRPPTITGSPTKGQTASESTPHLQKKHPSYTISWEIYWKGKNLYHGTKLSENFKTRGR